MWFRIVFLILYGIFFCCFHVVLKNMTFLARNSWLSFFLTCLSGPSLSFISIVPFLLDFDLTFSSVSSV